MLEVMAVFCQGFYYCLAQGDDFFFVVSEFDAVTGFVRDVFRFVVDNRFKHRNRCRVERRYIHLDVTQEEQWKRAIAYTVAEFGKLDVLLNNAGVGHPMKVEDMPEEIWDREMAIHAKGVFLGTKHAIPAMRAAGGGSIVNTSSVMGIVGSPTTPAYSAAKGAIRSFTKSAALQYAAEGIRINSVHPGYADTTLTEGRFHDPEFRAELLRKTPIGRLGVAEDIANGMLYLASDEASFVTGAELVIDGGMTAI